MNQDINTNIIYYLIHKNLFCVCANVNTGSPITQKHLCADMASVLLIREMYVPLIIACRDCERVLIRFYEDFTQLLKL